MWRIGPILFTAFALLEKAMAHVIRVVRWEELSPAQKNDVENLKISDQQIEYAGPTHRAVAACASDVTGDVQGAAIFDGDVTVGFLVLKRRAANPSWASTAAAVSRIGVKAPGMIAVMAPVGSGVKRGFERPQECGFLLDFATAVSPFSGIGLGLRKLSPSMTMR
jgi:hypothetical protein